MRTTEAERVRYVEVFRRSGLTPVEFCREYGLNTKTFYAWRKRYLSNNVEEIKRCNSSKSKPALLGEASLLPVHIKDDEMPSEGLPKQPIPLLFKTQSFCFEVALDAQHNGAELRLIVQTLHDLV
jgi:hypothetical protein